MTMTACRRVSISPGNNNSLALFILLGKGGWQTTEQRQSMNHCERRTGSMGSAERVSQQNLGIRGILKIFEGFPTTRILLEGNIIIR